MPDQFQLSFLAVGPGRSGTTWLHEAHTRYWQDLLAEDTHTAATGYGLTCPVSGKGGGVRELSNTLTHVYDAL